ncbi:hypothetical protein IPM19_04970 [bacterium]|nr:MAG: hypothetical protein IPM19_04970 [bacterium]
MKRVTIALLLLVVCFVSMGSECDGPNTEERKQFEKKKENTQSLMSKQETPVIGYSMDRYLLSERITRFNSPNKMSYLYVVLADGTWLQITILGKLTSTSKRLTKPEEEYWIMGSNNTLGPAADEMGVYGSSDPAKVGMTTLGSLIEFGGFASYIYSETPLNFKGKNVIELTVEATPEEKEQLTKKLEQMKNAMR